MPDTPDYSRYLPSSQKFSLQDYGELAARLLSPVNFDRRGEVLAIEDFDYGYNAWAASTAGADSYIKLEAGYAGVTPYCMHFKAGTSSKYTVTLQRSLASWGLTRGGLEFTFSIGDWSDSVDANMGYSDGTKWHEIDLRIIRDATNPFQLYYNGAYHDIVTGFDLGQPISMGKTAKIVADFQNDKYIRLVYQGLVIDLTDIPLYNFAFVGPPWIAVTIRLRNQAGHSTEMYLSRVIVTSNEP